MFQGRLCNFAPCNALYDRNTSGFNGLLVLGCFIMAILIRICAALNEPRHNLMYVRMFRLISIEHT
jgi:hypothetical protein